MVLPRSSRKLASSHGGFSRTHGGFSRTSQKTCANAGKVVHKLSSDGEVEPTQASGLWVPLRRSPFRRLTFSYGLNEMGDWLGIIALAVLVFDRTDSALATMGLFLGTRFLPSMVSPALVARIERASPRLTLGALYCAEAAAFATLALLVDHFSLAAVIAVATIDGTLALAARSLTRGVTE